MGGIIFPAPVAPMTMVSVGKGVAVCAAFFSPAAGCVQGSGDSARARCGDVWEASGEAGVILQGLELNFGEGVGVTGDF